jgi:thiosulfate/3-mercaptopyruvate sulfurtransferase
MKKKTVLCVMFCLAWFFVMGLVRATGGAYGEKLVSTDWLKDNLNDARLVILHIGKKADFEKEHIPNARPVSPAGFIVDGQSGLKHELPDNPKLEALIRSWGVNRDSKIVICYAEDKAISLAARLFFTLDYAGLGSQTAILNGGLPRWKNENGPLTPESAASKPGDFQLHPNPQAVVDKKWVAANRLNANIILIDARPEGAYAGEEEAPDLPRRGHIEGALNIPFSQLFVDDKPYMWKDKAGSAKVFAENGIPRGTTIVAYCGSGIWAAPLYVVAKELGYDVRLYDGSFQEWSKDETLPVTGPVGVKKAN